MQEGLTREGEICRHDLRDGVYEGASSDESTEGEGNLELLRTASLAIRSYSSAILSRLRADSALSIPLALARIFEARSYQY